MHVISQFKPALLFLARFLAVYVVGNVLYGLYIESFGDEVDAVTRVVTEHTSALLQITGEATSTGDRAGRPIVLLMNASDGTVLNVFEGCNGLNVMIVFVAFLVAFGGPLKKMAWFIPAGLLIIHVFNLLRIGLLYYVATHFEQYFYFFHKYLFTAILYMVVFGLWVYWVTKIARTPTGGTERIDAKVNPENPDA